MDLFSSCEECSELAAFQIASLGHTHKLCRAHTAQWQRQGLFQQFPSRLVVELNDTETDALVSAQEIVQTLYSQEQAQITCQRDTAIARLIEDIRQTNAKFAETSLALAARVRTLREELRMMTSCRLAPLNSLSRLAGSLVQLRDTAELDETHLKPVLQQLLQPQLTDCPQQFTNKPFSQIVEEASLTHLAPNRALEWLCSRQTVFEHCQFENLDLSGANLTGGVFLNCSLNRSLLTQTKLDQTVLWNSTMTGCRLTDVIVKPAVLRREYQIWAAAYSPCGTYLAIGGASPNSINKLNLWKHGTGLGEIAYSTDVKTVAFSKCGKYLAVGGTNKLVKVYVVSHRKFHTEINAVGVVNALDWSPNSLYLAIGCDSEKPNLKVWSFQDRVFLLSFIAHKGAIKSLNFSSTGQWLATGGLDKRVMVWSIPDGDLHWSFEERSWSAGGKCPLRFLPTEERLVTGGCNGALRVWDLAVTYEVEPFPKKLSWVVSLDISRCGQFLAAADKTSCNVELFSVVNRQHLVTFTGHSYWVFAVAFSPCARFIATAAANKKLITFANCFAFGAPWWPAQYGGVDCGDAEIDSRVRAYLSPLA